MESVICTPAESHAFRNVSLPVQPQSVGARNKTPVLVHHQVLLIALSRVIIVMFVQGTVDTRAGGTQNLGKWLSGR